MQVSPEEQETTINLYPKKVSDRAEIYSCDPAFVRRIRKLSKERPDEVLIEKDQDGGLFASVPYSWVRVMPKRNVNMTPERKQELSERMKELRRNDRGSV